MIESSLLIYSFAALFEFPVLLTFSSFDCCTRFRKLGTNAASVNLLGAHGHVLPGRECSFDNRQPTAADYSARRSELRGGRQGIPARREAIFT